MHFVVSCALFTSYRTDKWVVCDYYNRHTGRGKNMFFCSLTTTGFVYLKSTASSAVLSSWASQKLSGFLWPRVDVAPIYPLPPNARDPSKKDSGEWRKQRC